MKETNGNRNYGAVRRHYDETFKRHAVELSLRTDRTVKAVAEDLGLRVGVLYQWRMQYGPRPSGPSGLPGPRTLEEAEAENRQLRAELIRMREREIVLKKSVGILSETPESGMSRSQL